jgi:hypothetical protein
LEKENMGGSAPEKTGRAVKRNASSGDLQGKMMRDVKTGAAIKLGA